MTSADDNKELSEKEIEELIAQLPQIIEKLEREVAQTTKS